MKFSMWLIDPRPDLPTIVQLVEKGFELSDSLSKKFFLIHGHFEPRGQYAPEFREGLCQDVSSADEIGVAYVIAGDTSKHLSLAVAPIVLTTCGTCSGSASRIDSNRQNTVFRCQAFDPLPHPPICPRGGGFAKALASGFGCPFLQSVQVFKADGGKAMPRQLFDSIVDVPITGDAGAPFAFASRTASPDPRRDCPPIRADRLPLAGRDELGNSDIDADHIAAVSGLRLSNLYPDDKGFLRQCAAL